MFGRDAAPVGMAFRARIGTTEELLLVSQAWDRPPVQIDLLRTTFQVLDDTEGLPARVLAAGAGLPVEAFADIPTSATGHPSGLIRTGRDSFRPATTTGPLTEPWDQAARDVAARIGEDVLTTLTTASSVLDRPVGGFEHRTSDATTLPPVRFADPDQVMAWIHTHLALLPAVVRACATARSRPLAVAVAARCWICAPDDAPHAWAHELADVGAQAAVDDRAVHGFTGLMRLSAQWFADHGDMVTAERHGVREWRAWQRLGDTDGMIDVLWHRAGLYRDAGQHDRELDCYTRLRSLYEDRDDDLGIARTTAATGTTFAGLGSDQDAVDHLYRASRRLASLPVATPAEQAAVAETLGRVYWRLGDHYAARRRFHAALRLLDSPRTPEQDEQAARRIRGLLDIPDGQPLPEP